MFNCKETDSLLWTWHCKIEPLYSAGGETGSAPEAGITVSPHLCKIQANSRIKGIHWNCLKLVYYSFYTFIITSYKSSEYPTLEKKEGKRVTFHLPSLIKCCNLFLPRIKAVSYNRVGCLHNTEVVNFSRLPPLQSVIRLATLFLSFTPPEMLFLLQWSHTTDSH